jgi:hypothetical protein
VAPWWTGRLIPPRLPSTAGSGTGSGGSPSSSNLQAALRGTELAAWNCARNRARRRLSAIPDVTGRSTKTRRSGTSLLAWPPCPSFANSSATKSSPSHPRIDRTASWDKPAFAAASKRWSALDLGSETRDLFRLIRSFPCATSGVSPCRLSSSTGREWKNPAQGEPG